MARIASALAVATAVCVAALTIGCGRTAALEEIPLGSRVSIETDDGRLIKGKLTEVTVDRVVVESEGNGQRHRLSRDIVTDVRPSGGLGLRNLLPAAPEPVELIVPADTVVPIELETTVTSDGNRLEDPVRAHTRNAVMVGGTVALPIDSELRGVITDAKASGKVQGRARLSFEFNEVTSYGETYDIVSVPFTYEAEGTKRKDAEKVGIGAAAGAIIGGLAGGKKGAAIGSVVGGGAGTAVVLTTPGKEVERRAGTNLQLRLRTPLTVHVPRDDS